MSYEYFTKLKTLIFRLNQLLNICNTQTRTFSPNADTASFASYVASLHLIYFQIFNINLQHCHDEALTGFKHEEM